MLLVLVLIITPMVVYAGNGDIAVSSVGFVILSAAVTIHKIRKYIGSNMNDEIQAAVDTKPAIIAAVGGGALTFTSANIISIAGVFIGVIGMVVGFLQWRENKRRNDLLEKELEWKYLTSAASDCGKKYKNGNSKLSPTSDGDNSR